MPAQHRTSVSGARDFEREWSRLIDDLARCGFLGLPGAADALLSWGEASKGQPVGTSDEAGDGSAGW